METIIKDLPLPKEATKMIEEVPVLQEIIEPEQEGIGWGAGIGLGALAIIVVEGLYKNYCRCKKK